MKIQQWLVVCCLTVSLPIQAADSFIPAGLVELNDAELAQLRGRFVLPGRIVSFGIIMSSTWQTANGQILGGQVGMQLQQDQPTPLFNVTIFSNGGQGTLPAGTGQLLGGNGLNQVQGVVQSTRSAGDFNLSHNGISIDVTHGNQAPAPANGQTILATTISTSNLGEVRVGPSNGGLQLAIQANGQGSTLQQLGGGSMIQRTDILSSNNRVENLAALNVMLREGTSSANGLNSEWTQLNTMRPAGF